MRVLYVCYQSLLDPLTQTQVVAYLEGLASITERIVLLTFEPDDVSESDAATWERRLADRGIVWKRLRYHRRPTLPATMWDVLAGTFAGWRLIRKHGIRMVHARSHVPAVMGCLLKRITGARLLFDFRGMLAEEYVDGGVWRSDGLLFRLTKSAERRLVNRADAVVVLTEQAKRLLHQWYPGELANKSVTVIPCCTDIPDWHSDGPAPAGEDAEDRSLTIAYVGKLGGWYLTDAMAEFVAVGISRHPQLRWQVWTQSDTQEFERRWAGSSLAGHVSVGTCQPSDLHRRLVTVDAGLVFYGRKLSQAACSPTKAAEYLAAGVPVVSTPGIGDLDAVLGGAFSDDGKPVGVIVPELTTAAYADAWRELLDLLDDPHLAARCRAVAQRLFDLRQVGWPRYRQVYAELLGDKACDEESSHAERIGETQADTALSR